MFKPIFSADSQEAPGVDSMSKIKSTLLSALGKSTQEDQDAFIIALGSWAVTQPDAYKQIVTPGMAEFLTDLVQLMSSTTKIDKVTLDSVIKALSQGV